MFTCEVTSQLSRNHTGTNSTSFTIRTLKESKFYLYINKLESGPVSELVISHINESSGQMSWMPPVILNGVIIIANFSCSNDQYC